MKCWATNLLLVICPLAMIGCPQPYGDDDDDNDSDDVTIEGTWTGGMDCSDPSGWMEMDVELPLADQGDMEFSGHLEGTGEAVVGGDSYPLRPTMSKRTPNKPQRPLRPATQAPPTPRGSCSRASTFYGNGED